MAGRRLSPLTNSLPGCRDEKTALLRQRGFTLILLFAWLLSGCASAALSPDLQETAQPLPTPGKVIDFEVKDLEGSPVRLSEHLGEVTLITFWASWCDACEEEMPVLDAYYRRHREQGFALVAVNAGEDAESAARYIAEKGYAFPVWSDPAGTQMLEAGARGLPYSILLDREGRRINFWYGAATAEFLDEAITPLLVTPGGD